MQDGPGFDERESAVVWATVANEATFVHVERSINTTSTMLRFRSGHAITFSEQAVIQIDSVV